MGAQGLWLIAWGLVIAGCDSGGEVAPPPTAPQASASARDSAVVLEWPAQADAVSYNVYWATTSGVTTGTQEVLRNVTPPVQHTELSNGVTYYYVVTAVGAGGESEASAEVSATPQPAPEAPAGLLVNAGDEQITVTWNTTPGASAYRVRATDAEGNPVGDTPATTRDTNYVLSGLVNGTTYHVQITALNSSGESSASQSVSITPTRLLDVALASTHLCALRSTGNLWCWGNNQKGQFGNGSTSTELSTVAQLVRSADSWTSTAAGIFHSCGTKQDGSLWCWGENGLGQLATTVVDGATEPRGVDLPEPDVAKVTSGATAQHSCALTAQGSLWCWGGNFFGQVGNDSSNSSASPARIGEADAWRNVAVSSLHTCGIKKDASLWCWGANFMGQLGDGSFTDRLAPTQIGTEKTWRAVSASVANTCAIEAGGALWCWGFNDAGQIGDGTLDLRGAPVLVAGDASWREVAAGTAFTCGIRDDASLWCWGGNGHGELGDGTNENRTEPTANLLTGPWDKVYAGDFTACATRPGGDLYCWGDNANGLLGAADPAANASPALIGVP